MTRGRGTWAPTTGAGPLFGTAPPCSSTGGGALTGGALNGHPSGGAFTVCGFCGSSAAAGVAFGRAHSPGLGTLPHQQHPILVPRWRGFGSHAQCQPSSFRDVAEPSSSGASSGALSRKTRNSASIRARLSRSSAARVAARLAGIRRQGTQYEGRGPGSAALPYVATGRGGLARAKHERHPSPEGAAPAGPSQRLDGSTGPSSTSGPTRRNRPHRSRTTQPAVPTGTAAQAFLLTDDPTCSSARGRRGGLGTIAPQRCTRCCAASAPPRLPKEIAPSRQSKGRPASRRV